MTTRRNFIAHNGTTMVSAKNETALQGLAGAAYSFFDMHMLSAGGYRYTLRSGSPRWVEDLVVAAHADMKWDEWRLRFIADALDALRSMPDPDDCEMDGDLDVVKLGLWFASHPHRYARCDQEMSNHGDEGLADTSIRVVMAMGQANERNEVLDLVRTALEARRDKIIADEARAAEVDDHINGLLNS
jgi:hypothetical protein